MAPLTVEQLRTHGVTPESQLKLEFFFYTNSQTKAESLQQALLKEGYEVETGLSASDTKMRLVTGWTTRMPMNDSAVSGWASRMCKLGYEHDCEFDGWGTNPSQAVP
ncbi:MAG: ribonuclease E inhibitor RraB [Candidatus Hydrogenedentes bacterium]|nr:ribonuclease E inhibitor RraB [Candidatus Hydrogenedentota bacterium]